MLSRIVHILPSAKASVMPSNRLVHGLIVLTTKAKPCLAKQTFRWCCQHTLCAPRTRAAQSSHPVCEGNCGSGSGPRINQWQSSKRSAGKLPITTRRIALSEKRLGVTTQIALQCLHAHTKCSRWSCVSLQWWFAVWESFVDQTLRNISFLAELIHVRVKCLSYELIVTDVPTAKFNLNSNFSLQIDVDESCIENIWEAHFYFHMPLNSTSCSLFQISFKKFC